MTIEIVEINEARALKNEHMGIRFDNREYKIGEDVANSYDYNAEEREDYNGEGVELEGTCALQFGGGMYFDDIEELKNEAVAVLESSYNYESEYQYLIAGTQHHIGDDDNEVIIENAEVIGILKITK